jgi:hypothetical protein
VQVTGIRWGSLHYRLIIRVTIITAAILIAAKMLGPVMRGASVIIVAVALALKDVRSTRDAPSFQADGKDGHRAADQ